MNHSHEQYVNMIPLAIRSNAVGSHLVLLQRGLMGTFRGGSEQRLQRYAH